MPEPNIKGKKLATASIILYLLSYLSPMVGLMGSVVGMHSAFAVLGKSGATDMNGLGHSISGVLITLAVGLVFCFVFAIAAWIVNGLALFWARYRPVWYIWVTCIFGGFSLIGILNGIALVIIMLIDHLHHVAHIYSGRF